jgi:hypothetical protein
MVSAKRTAAFDERWGRVDPAPFGIDSESRQGQFQGLSPERLPDA